MICKYVVVFLTIIQMLIMIILNLTLFKRFLMQQEIQMLIIMITFCMFLIRINIVESLVVPKHDRGITVWWLCCIKFGQQGKYSARGIKKEYRQYVKKNIEKEKILLGQIRGNF